MNQTEAFHQRIDAALHNDQLRHNFRAALTGINARRAEQFPDDDQLQALREQARQVRANSLVGQPDLLERLEAKLIANGIQVHWARDAAEANGLIIELLRERQADALLRGKSMVSEETELNHYLEQRGIEVIERHIMPEELEGFQQCWLTGTAAEVTPVGQIGDYNFEVGAMTREISDAYEKLVRS